ncbi:MAG: PQQ-binding-like beta-propeller repeat protein [Thermomicrobiales bacterium]
MDDLRFLDTMRRFWDDVARGGPATPGDLDPTIAAEIQRLHANPGVEPNPAYGDHLREMLMHATTAPLPLTITTPANGHTAPPAAPPARPGFSPGHAPARQRPAWAAWQPALILLLIVALLGAFFTVFRQGQQQQPAIQPAVATPAPANPGAWPLYRGDPARTGAMPGPGITGPPAILWRFHTDAADTSFAAALAAGVLYVPADNGALYALDAATGDVRWQAEAGLAMPSVSDGVLYFVSPNAELAARDLATGQELWRAATGNQYWTPLVVGDTVYYPGEANLLIARDARTGAQRWAASVAAPASRSAALADGVLVAGSEDHHVYGLDPATGQTRWSYALGDDNATIQTPAIADGVVYVGTFGSSQNTFVALDLQTGAERWRLDGVDSENFRAAGAAEDLVFLPSDDGTLRALDVATGDVRWTYASTAGYAMASAPTIVDGVVYAGASEDGNGLLVALDATTGDLHWQLPLDGQMLFGPVVVESRLYIGTEIGNVYAIGSAGDLPAGATPAVMTAAGATPPAPEPAAAPTAGTPTAASAATATLTQEWTLSNADGTFAGGLSSIAVDPFGRLWTCNLEDGSIQILDRDGNELAHVTGGLGSGPGEWNWVITTPTGGEWDGCGIAFAPDGTAYVTDGGNDRIKVLDPSGALLDSWSTLADGDDFHSAPVVLTRLANGDLLVFDFIFNQSAARRFSPDGTFLGDFTLGSGMNPATFDPAYAVLDGAGNLWIAEWNENRVVKLAPDGSLLQAIGGTAAGSGPGQFKGPTSVALDEHGNIFVADNGNQRIQVFAPDSAFIAQFTGEEAGIPRFGAEGGGTAMVTSGGRGYLYVSDYARGDLLNGDQRLIKFRITLPAASPAATPVATPAS